MICRTFKILTAVSAFFLGLSLLLAIAARLLDPWTEHSISLRPKLYVGVGQAYPSDIVGRVAIFNDRESGPYRGNIIALPGGGSSLLERSSFGDAWGIYYRHFRWPNYEVWTLMVSLAYPIWLFALLPIAWLIREANRRRRSARLLDHQ
jgi:hypothetical protein